MARDDFWPYFKDASQFGMMMPKLIPGNGETKRILDMLEKGTRPAPPPPCRRRPAFLMSQGEKLKACQLCFSFLPLSVGGLLIHAEASISSSFASGLTNSHSQRYTRTALRASSSESSPPRPPPPAPKRTPAPRPPTPIPRPRPPAVAAVSTCRCDGRVGSSCSPRHRMTFDSIHEDQTTLNMR